MTAQASPPKATRSHPTNDPLLQPEPTEETGPRHDIEEADSADVDLKALIESYWEDVAEAYIQ
jgi:hypothetical protein